METVFRAMAFTGLVVLASCGNATDPQQPHSAATGPDTGGHTLCANGEHALFSCEVADKGTVASLCTSANVDVDSGYMYYAYGTPDRIELTYPAEKLPPAGNFARTHLVLAGGSGGYAYSFSNADMKYILYSISGAMGLDQQGVLAIDDSGRTQAALGCAPGTLIEDDTDDLQSLSRKLSSDESIERHGLPLID